MKALEKEEKDRIKFQYAVGLYKALKKSSLNSFRQLAKEAGMEPAHMQRISVGKVDVSQTTSISIALALGISFTQLASYYDSVSKDDVYEFKKYLKDQKELKGKTSIKKAETRNKSQANKKTGKLTGKDDRMK